jgi:hypothetical protein
MNTESPELEPTDPIEGWTKRLKLDSAILLAAMPLAAYVLVSGFIIGKYRYFGVPFELLSVSLIDNLATLLFLSLLGLFLCLTVVLLIVYIGIFIHDSKSIEKTDQDFPPLLDMSPNIIFKRRPFFAALSVCISFVLALGLCTMLIISPNTQYLDKWFLNLLVIALSILTFAIGIFATMYLIKWSFAANKVFRGSLLSLFATAGLAISMSFLSFSLGRFSAAVQYDFYIISGRPELAVLYLTSERLVASTFDRNTSTLGAEITAIFLEDLDGRLLKLEQVGPLKPYEVPPKLEP